MGSLVAPVRFKFLIGEFHLGSWRPQFAALTAPASDGETWPALTDVPLEGLPAETVGYWCRYAGTARFPVGISRLGPWLCYVPRRERLYFVEISGSFDEYLGRRSAKSRYNVKRALRVLQERNQAGVLEIACEPEEMAGFLREASVISRQTYQSRLLQSGLPDSADFLASMEALARRGDARGYLLRDQGRAIAFAWCSGEGDRLTYDVIGYLEESAALSPGTVLLYLILDDLFRLGRYGIFDFGVGEAQYKQVFSTASLDFADAYLFKATWPNRLRVSLHWQLDRFSSAVGAALERAGVKKRVKRILRRLHRGSS